MDLISIDVNRLLDWIGIEAMDNARISLQSDGFSTFTSMVDISETQISSMKTRYGRNGINDIGDNRMLDVIGTIYWVKDRYRIGEVPSLVNIRDGDHFRLVLEKARTLAYFRNRLNSNHKFQQHFFFPGNFIDSETWSDYEKSLVRYLGVMLGVLDIPLTYVIREVDYPAEPIDEENCVNFYEETIARAPLHGRFFQTDAETVHHIIRRFLRVRTDNFQCLDALTVFQDGRRDMIELRKHHYGEGNTCNYPPRCEGCGCRNIV